MNPDEKYRLTTYKEISLLSEDKNKRIYIVKDEVSEILYVKKIFQSMDNFNLYKRLNSLRHKNLTGIRDVIKGDNEIYVIEDYVNGQTLKALMENKGPLPEIEVIGYILQICDALEYLHSQNSPIIHRDIKPENIICGTDNIIKLVDFDIAREFKETAKRDTVFMGTKEYAAPEQYGYKQTDCRADIFSVGVLIHELITGRLPENNITYNGALRKIIDKCVEIDPDKRFQSVYALKKTLTGVGLNRRRKITVFVSVVATLSGLAIVYFLIFQHYTGNPDSYYISSDISPVATESADTDLFTPEPMDTEPVASEPSVDLYSYFEKIESGDKKPLILLENEAINKTIHSITGDFYDNVTGAFQEYYAHAGYSAYYNPDINHLCLPACNIVDGYIHDMLLFEMEGEFLSISYYDYDLETTYYFTTEENKGHLTPEAFNWIKSNPLLYENPVVFNQSPLEKKDIIGVYYIGNMKKIEIFEDGNGIKFSYTDIRNSKEAKPLIIETIYKLDDCHYWMKNVTFGNKNRLIFNFSENHLTLFTELFDEMIYLGGIYDKE